MRVTAAGCGVQLSALRCGAFAVRFDRTGGQARPGVACHMLVSAFLIRRNQQALDASVDTAE